MLDARRSAVHTFTYGISVLLHTLKHLATLCARPSRHRVACLVSCMRPRVFASAATGPAVAGEA